jgi:hypothetical protein
MANIVGEQFRSYVAKQIKSRQKVHGSGTDGNPRNPEYLSYLNSKTAWVKLASGVRIDPERIKDEKFASGYAWDTLAQNFILFGGTARLDSGNKELIQRGTNLDNQDGVYDYYAGIYNVNAKKLNSSLDFGLVPMPGIESVDVKNKNRGSIREATVKIKAYNREQFDIIDLLYLRLGYTVLLEWGNSLYVNNDFNDPKLESMGYTLTEDPNGFFGNKYNNHRQFLNLIEGYRNGKQGNYDGLFGKIKNFNWSFNPDGSYDIEISLISLGDVIESLKSNITPSTVDLDFINSQNVGTEENGETTKGTIESSAKNNIISAFMLYIKILLKQNTENGTTDYTSPKDVSYTIAGSEPYKIGTFLDLSQDVKISGNQVHVIKTFENKTQAESWVKDNYPNTPSTTEDIDYSYTGPLKYKIIELSTLFGLGDSDYQLQLHGKPETTIDTEGMGKKDVVYLNYDNGEDEEIFDSGFYWRFGALLEYMNNNVLPVEEKTKSPIISINDNKWESKMAYYPNQISFDPRVCIVNGILGDTKVFPQLIPWRNEDKGYAWPLNIYLSFVKIQECIDSNLDDEGNLAIYPFLESICTALNEALGGINNLEPVIDEDANEIYIIDDSFSTDKTTKADYELELYGYKGNTSNFVRNVDLKTAIDPSYATMITVGATAGGYVKGTEATMFSKWNAGLIDRFKEKYIPVNKDTQADQNEARTNYFTNFYNQSPGDLTLGYKKAEGASDDIPQLQDDVIDANKSLATEYYKWLNSKAQFKNNDFASAALGFIPFNLGITMDGIGGIKIYNELNVDTRFLPKRYPDSLRFLIKGVNHRLSNQDWETQIETVVIPNTLNKKIGYDFLKELMDSDIGEFGSQTSSEETGGEEVTPNQPRSNPPLETPTKSQTNSDLEKKTKEAAINWFKTNGEKLSACGAYTYDIARKLAEKLTNKTISRKGGNDAYSSVLRSNLKELGIYAQSSLTPIGVGLSLDEAKSKANQVTQKANYGDVLIYYVTPPPQGKGRGKYRFHAQIYTGNQYKGTGWSTSTKTNYGTTFAYNNKTPWTMYWFRVKDEYKK